MRDMENGGRKHLRTSLRWKAWPICIVLPIDPQKAGGCRLSLIFHRAVMGNSPAGLVAGAY